MYVRVSFFLPASRGFVVEFSYFCIKPNLPASINLISRAAGYLRPIPDPMITILIIDDNNDIRENIAEILMLGGYSTLEAEHGKKGVELAIKNKPSLIICDIMMPVLDGYGVLHLLKKNPDTDQIPFIFLTAKAERTDFRRGMEMGADDFITKPFDDIELLNAIEVRLKKLEILHNKYVHNDDGASKLVKDLSGSGLFNMDFSAYDCQSFCKKQVLYSENKNPRYLYYLKSGKVKTYKQHEDGKDYIINLYKENDFIGYLSLIENTVYEESAEVLEDAEIVLIPKDDFLAAISTDFTIAAKFIKLIARNVKEHEDRLLNLAYSSLRKRVARALVSIQEKYSSSAPQSINISREDIARYVGTATESLIRTLSDFKAEKLIEVKEGKICVLNVEKLKSLLY